MKTVNNQINKEISKLEKEHGKLIKDHVKTIGVINGEWGDGNILADADNIEKKIMYLKDALKSIEKALNK